MGNLLEEGFINVWFKKKTKWIRGKEAAPNECKSCKYFLFPARELAPYILKYMGAGNYIRSVEILGIMERKEYGMRNRTGFFGFPSHKEQDSVQFYIFKSIPYTTRMAMYLMLIFVGFVFQFLTFTAFSGVVFLVCATLLNLMKGYNGRINIQEF